MFAAVPAAACVTSRRPRVARCYDDILEIILRSLCKLTAIPRSELVVNRDHFVTMVKWHTERQLVVAWSNRRRNSTWLTVCSPNIATSSADCRVVSSADDDDDAAVQHQYNKT